MPKGMEMIRAEPLRSPSQLPGVSGLKDLDSKRVAAANNICIDTVPDLHTGLSRGFGECEKSSQFIFMGYHANVGAATSPDAASVGIPPR